MSKTIDKQSEQLTVKQILKELRKKCESRGSQRNAARSLDVSLTYLNDVLNGRRKPGKSMLGALGLKKVITYRRLRSAGHSRKPTP